MADDSEPPTSSRPLTPTMAESDPPTALVRRHATYQSGDGCIELPPGSVVGEIYEIDAMLGAGAMGEVYAAHHMKLGKRVAIKVIGPRLSEDNAAIERFAMEARTLAQVQHPAIVAVDHIGELADGRAYFVMEFLKGESLFERMSRGRVPLREALRFIDQMARGLEAAHARGITHRDLKPENTFLVYLPGEAPIVKLLDFGLAKLAADVANIDRRAERTQSGVAIGTPMYMSPEQMRGYDVDHRTDIYALGCVAYELVLGRSPFPHAKTAPELFAAHIHESPPLPRSIWPEIPPQLDLALFAMLAKDPAHRPTLTQIRAVIAAVSEVGADRAETVLVGPRVMTPRMRNAVLGAVALVSGIVIGAIIAKSRGTPPGDVPTVPVVDSATPRELASPAPPRTELALPTTTPPASDVAPKPRNTVPRSTRQTTPKVGAGSAAVKQSISDVRIGPPVAEPPRATKPSSMDRNQTVNPFKRNQAKPSREPRRGSAKIRRHNRNGGRQLAALERSRTDPPNRGIARAGADSGRCEPRRRISTRVPAGCQTPGDGVTAGETAPFRGGTP